MFFIRVKEKMVRFIQFVLIKLCGIRTRIAIRRNKGDNNKVFLIKYDGLGDFVLFLNAAKAIRQLYAGKKIVFSCPAYSVPYAKASGCFDEIITVEHTGFSIRNICKTYAVLRKNKYDVLLHPTQPRSIHAEIIAYLVNAKTKIASVGECGGISRKTKERWDKTYDRFIDQGIQNMTLIQGANFLRGLGAVDYKAGLPFIDMKKIGERHICLPQDFFIIFMGASVYNKQWDPLKYYEVARYIKRKTGWECVLCGDDGDREQEELFDRKGTLRYYSFVGKTNLHDLAYIISKARLVVGNDTSAIHIANALNVQSICIKGHFSGEKFYPYVTETDEGDRVTPITVSCPKEQFPCYFCTIRDDGRGGYSCIQHYYAKEKVRCIDEISVEMVCEATDEWLSTTGETEQNRS